MPSGRASTFCRRRRRRTSNGSSIASPGASDTRASDPLRDRGLRATTSRPAQALDVCGEMFVFTIFMRIRSPAPSPLVGIDVRPCALPDPEARVRATRRLGSIAGRSRGGARARRVCAPVTGCGLERTPARTVDVRVICGRRRAAPPAGGMPPGGRAAAPAGGSLRAPLRSAAALPRPSGIRPPRGLGARRLSARGPPTVVVQPRLQPERPPRGEHQPLRGCPGTAASLAGSKASDDDRIARNDVRDLERISAWPEDGSDHHPRSRLSLSPREP